MQRGKKTLADTSNDIKAIQAVQNSQMAYCKFLSANDTGYTGAHQSGIYITKNAVDILFDEPGKKGENKDKFIKIQWQNDFYTDSRFIYYGRGTRNEYRITRFSKGFPYLTVEHTGDLFVLVKNTSYDYSGYILETEDEINNFLNSFNMNPTDTGKIISKDSISLDSRINLAFINFINSLDVDFPSSDKMSEEARTIFSLVYDHDKDVIYNPDKMIISWIDMEYQLFRKLEQVRYDQIIKNGFSSVEQLVKTANIILNRRKSRAGKSLEHNLAAIFKGNNLRFSSQPRTEGHKKPDFIFPAETFYHDNAYPSNRLVFLGAKTTCKDRWRQIINEADRIPIKHLFTLQQGISINQLNEMENENVIPVVPKAYINTYPKAKQYFIWTLQKFIAYAKEKTAL